jgi:nucleoside-diphosphate-sugar epimerase
MKILLAGASGAIGTPLVRQLISHAASAPICTPRMSCTRGKAGSG